MICQTITYRHFRNIESAKIILSDGVTVFGGKNGQGKTNLLEGIYCFATGRSFRTPHEENLVKFGAEFAELNMTFRTDKQENQMTMRYLPTSGKRYCQKNGVSLTKLSEVMGNFRAVLFCPDHLSLVQDGPAVRRRFLDNALSQIDGSYLRTLQRHHAILEQRNALIKAAREKRDDQIFYQTADLWSEQLAEQAADISEKRDHYLAALNAAVQTVMSDMTGGKEKPMLIYQHRYSKEDYVKMLHDNTERELRFGATLFGAHKDDIGILLNDKEARTFSSQGQQRSIALAMKIAEGELSKKVTGEYPVFLFDDILSELDPGRRSYLLGGLNGRQVVITSCDKIETDGFRYTVNAGEVIKETLSLFR